jgi:hypothetical protein
MGDQNDGRGFYFRACGKSSSRFRHALAWRPERSLHLQGSRFAFRVRWFTRCFTRIIRSGFRKSRNGGNRVLAPETGHVVGRVVNDPPGLLLLGQRSTPPIFFRAAALLPRVLRGEDHKVVVGIAGQFEREFVSVGLVDRRGTACKKRGHASSGGACGSASATVSGSSSVVTAIAHPLLEAYTLRFNIQ